MKLICFQNKNASPRSQQRELTSCLTRVRVMKCCQRECRASFVLNVHSAQLCSDEEHNSKRSSWLQFSHVVHYRPMQSPLVKILGSCVNERLFCSRQKINYTSAAKG
ncbi:hypothetical protein ATANTOWER_032471 [Ataeniobius toweri]|uniref:Uncharacterized protein n=1 Tax=Ataeniobius toweri TaxID=208326 RepID=A0ABU7C551_9TELE|nr:hypothetical protein [Ataeniobius toweri]